MIIYNNTLLKIEEKDIIDGVFIAPDNITEISSSFRVYGNLYKLILPNVTKIGDYFMGPDNTLISLEIPNVETIGSFFLFKNKNIKELNIPKVKIIGTAFLFSNEIFNYTIDIVKAIDGEIYIGSGEVKKSEIIRKINIKKLL